MKTLFLILAVIAVLVLLGGALNHETQVSLDYLVGSTPGVSVFWFAIGVGAGLLLAGLAGWSVGRAGGGDTRAKLERELESTYRRLRDCEVKLPGPHAPLAAAPAAAAAPADEAVTVAAPMASSEAVTAVAPAPADGAFTVDAPADLAEAATAVTEVAGDGAEPAAAPAPDAEVDTVVAPAAPGEAGADDAPAS